MSWTEVFLFVRRRKEVAVSNCICVQSQGRVLGGIGACPGSPAALPEPQPDPAVASALPGEPRHPPVPLMGVLSCANSPTFIPRQRPCCCRRSRLAAPSLGFISEGRNGAVFLPGELGTGVCCISRMLREGRCWRACIGSTKLVLRAAQPHGVIQLQGY